jgi:hypothetical protein
MKNLKTTMIAALLMLAAVGEVVAQEKYEFAIVCNYGTDLTIAKHSTEVIHLPKGSDAWGELIKKVEAMNKDGWEVYNSTSSDNVSHAYYLRRKIKE